MKSKRVWLLAVAAVVVIAVAGVLAWLVIPVKSRGSATGSPAASGPVITGKAVKQLLLDGADLTKMLGQPFTRSPGSSRYGDLDQMDDSPTPGDCAGVANVAPRNVYRSADVQSYARETWADATPRDAGADRLSTKVMFVVEAVVALPSAAAAQELFAKFAEQWKSCDGQPLNQEPDIPDADNPPHLPGTEMHITDVRVTDTVLAASIVLDQNPKAPDTRAIGVQGNCIVGVLVAFTGGRHATGSGDPQTSSTDAVRAMMGKVGELN